MINYHICNDINYIISLYTMNNFIVIILMVDGRVMILPETYSFKFLQTQWDSPILRFSRFIKKMPGIISPCNFQ